MANLDGVQVDLALETPGGVAPGGVMDPAPLMEELRSSFYRVGQALASSLNVDETLKLIADSTVEIMRAQAATVHLVEDEGRRLTLKASSGHGQDTLARLQV